MAETILSKGQQKLHTAILWVSVFLLANAGYLAVVSDSFTARDVPSAFYQWMLVSHVVVGTLLLLPMSVFVVWHLRRALAMRNRRAIWTGVAVTAAAYALFATGLFLFERANSAGNRTWFWSHRALALAAPASYVVHRLVAHHPLRSAAVWRGLLTPIALALVFVGVHFATRPAPRPEPQSFVQRPSESVDPFLPKFPEYGVSGAPKDSRFYPAATRSHRNEYLPKGLLTNADTSTEQLLESEIRDHGFAKQARIGSETCARCHADIVEQWSKSAHRFASFNNPFYRAAVEKLREEDDGRTRSRWCAGCHDPAIMMAGNWMGDIDPKSPESQAGLTCLACHLMDEVHGVGGNGNYRINDLQPSPYLFAGAKEGVLPEVHDLLVKSKPDAHKLDMLKPVFRTSEYCGTCHKVSLDFPVNRYRWFRGQNEYDNHQDSGVTRNNARTFYLPPVAKTCQDCHMPLVPAPLGDVSAKEGKVRSHSFPGPNTALPHIRGDTETVKAIETFLQEAKMRVDVFAVKQGGRVEEAPALRDAPLVIAPGEDAEIQIVVRNQGVGHTFPGGTLDSNESWIHFRVADAADPSQTLFESGAVDSATRLVDRDAHFYRVVFVDDQGRECDLRNPHDFRAAAHLKVIGPGTADVVRYGISVPPEWVGKKLLVSATLKWRKFMPHYVDFVWNRTMEGRPKPDLPITDIASGKATFVVGAVAAPAPAVDGAVVAKEWVKWNDWGIGLLLQGDTQGAERAFGLMRDADPKRVDGWRNLARTKLADGAAREALDLLQQADARDPGNPQTAYFLAQSLDRLGQLDAAAEQYRKAQSVFQDDRTIHRALASIAFRLGNSEESLRSALRALAIDPEDREAHKLRMEAYGAMAGEAADPEKKKELLSAFAESERAFRKFTIDESAQKWTNTFRRERPDVNFESLPIHVHPLRRIR